MHVAAWRASSNGGPTECWCATTSGHCRRGVRVAERDGAIDSPSRQRKESRTIEAGERTDSRDRSLLSLAMQKRRLTQRWEAPGRGRRRISH